MTNDLQTFELGFTWIASVQGRTGTQSAPHPNQRPESGNLSPLPPGWGLMCSKACWAPAFTMMSDQASLSGSGVPLDSPLEGHLLLYLASIMPGFSQEVVYFTSFHEQPTCILHSTAGQAGSGVTGSANWKASRMSLGVMVMTGAVTAAKLAAEVDEREEPVGLMTPSMMDSQLQAQMNEESNEYNITDSTY